MAKRNSTRLVASLSRLSPSSSVESRRGSFTDCRTARAETASGGETIAPTRSRPPRQVRQQPVRYDADDQRREHDGADREGKNSRKVLAELGTCREISAIH